MFNAYISFFFREEQWDYRKMCDVIHATMTPPAGTEWKQRQESLTIILDSLVFFISIGTTVPVSIIVPWLKLLWDRNIFQTSVSNPYVGKIKASNKICH